MPPDPTLSPQLQHRNGQKPHRWCWGGTSKTDPVLLSLFSPGTPTRQGKSLKRRRSGTDGNPPGSKEVAEEQCCPAELRAG